MISEPKIDKKTREQMVYGSGGEYEIVDSSFFVEMDNHGTNINLCVFRRRGEEELWAFPWGSSSEEHFFDEQPCFRVKSQKRTITVFQKENGEEFTAWELSIDA